MPQKITKAIIPAAGFGTRLFPATKAIKKELFPIVDCDGKAKPIILIILEEAFSAGIERVGIIVRAEDERVFRDFLQTPPKAELLSKLSPEDRQYCSYLQELGSKIDFIVQDRQEGYGHAVYCAKNWVNNEPFLLLLGDHIYRSTLKSSCAEQIIQIYEKCDRSILGLTEMSIDIIHKAGCITGNWQDDNMLLDITQIYEKPTVEYARQNLRTQGMQTDRFLGIFGIYALGAAIFSYLEVEIKANKRYKGEFQLTTCLENMRRDLGMLGYLVRGKYFDTGMPEFYRQTAIEFSQTI
jgi:UTP--glucose-1-phosphate uridylyltransferase